MRKWVKRSLLGVALVMSLIALFLTGGFILLRGTPDYYRRTRLTAEQRAAAATRAEAKITQMQNLATDLHGAELQQRNGTTRPAAPPGATTFSFTDDELNALFNKWAELNNWKDLYERVVDEPMIILQDGKIIFAGNVNLKGIDTVVSIHFKPTITPDGQLDLRLAGILGGKLPLPKDTAISPLKQRVLQQIDRSLPGWQASANILPDGTANDPAVKAEMSKLLANTLNEQPGDPVVFLWRIAHGNKMIPVKLTDVTIADNALSITVLPMTASERANLLEQIKRPMESLAQRMN
jgi:hypothetical protein